jgi:hypothetical protein
MKVFLDPTYNVQFPEQFNWKWLESPALKSLAVELSEQIKIELTESASELVPGLRFALGRIAMVARTYK